MDHIEEVELEWIILRNSSGQGIAQAAGRSKARCHGRRQAQAVIGGSR
jgi:hypothetical protein